MNTEIDLVEVEDLLSNNNYTLGELICKGSLSDVYSISDGETDFAGKIYFVDENNMMVPKEIHLRDHIIAELEYLKKLILIDEIVTYHDQIVSDKYIILIMELCSVNLKRFLSLNQDRELPEQLVLIILKQLVCGISKLHQMDIIHRNIELESFMFLDDNITVKIGGFGSACDLEGKSNLSLSNITGNNNYLAPEIFNRKSGNSKASDVWAIGILGLELCVGTQKIVTTDLLSKYNMTYIRSLFRNTKYSSDMIDFIVGALKYEKDDRYLINELSKHKIFENYNKVLNEYINSYIPQSNEIITQSEIRKDNGLVSEKLTETTLDNGYVKEKLIESIKPGAIKKEKVIETKTVDGDKHIQSYYSTSVKHSNGYNDDEDDDNDIDIDDDDFGIFDSHPFALKDSLFNMNDTESYIQQRIDAIKKKMGGGTGADNNGPVVTKSYQKSYKQSNLTGNDDKNDNSNQVDNNNNIGNHKSSHLNSNNTKSKFTNSNIHKDGDNKDSRNYDDFNSHFNRNNIFKDNFLNRDDDFFKSRFTPSDDIFKKFSRYEPESLSKDDNNINNNKQTKPSMRKSSLPFISRESPANLNPNTSGSPDKSNLANLKSRILRKSSLPLTGLSCSDYKPNQ